MIEFGFADESRIIYKEELESGNNADTITYFIKRALYKNGIDFSNTDYVSISNGPGTFTGLRISSAIAKGICFALGSKLIEIPTLDIIANKLKELNELPDSSELGNRRIISVIFSNTKTREFYYSVYERESGRMKRISEYRTDLMENILTQKAHVLINEELRADIRPDLKNMLTDVSNISDMESQYELTMEYIQDKMFSNYRTSEPFYMSEFIPKI